MRGELPGGSQLRLHQSAAGRRPGALVAGLLALMLLGGALSALLSRRSAGVTQQQLASAPTVRAAGQSDKLLRASNSSLMGVTRGPGAQPPGFRLFDQSGRTVTLSALARRHAVVLVFLDDRCSGDCPVLTAELADAYRDLGTAAAGVRFVAVNVDAAHAGPAALREFLAGAGRPLAGVPDFLFLSGPPPVLRRVWSRYGLQVALNTNGSVLYSDVMDFLAPGGAVRYQATPYSDLGPNGVGSLPAPMIRQWGEGIAQYARAALR